MVKFVGNVTKSVETLRKLLSEGYAYITERGYALSEGEDISTDDVNINNILCSLEED